MIHDIDMPHLVQHFKENKYITNISYIADALLTSSLPILKQNHFMLRAHDYATKDNINKFDVRMPLKILQGDIVNST